MQIDVALTVTAKGTKMLSLLIWIGADKTILENGAVYVLYQERAWMNRELPFRMDRFMVNSSSKLLHL